MEDFRNLSKKQNQIEVGLTPTYNYKTESVGLNFRLKFQQNLSEQKNIRFTKKMEDNVRIKQIATN